MIRGVIVGIVKDNVDPEKMHRVLVEYPVSNTEGRVESSWARICTPMAGINRGLAILPDIGTEVALAFSYRSQTPYVLGGVYNGGEDRPEPYKNDDEENNIRVFWSRNDHMVLFDDTKGNEKIQLGAKATERLNTESGVIWQTLDAPNKTYSEYCGGNTSWTAMEKITVKCKEFSLTANSNISMVGGQKVDRHAGGNMNFSASTLVNLAGSQVLRNSGVNANPTEAIGGLSGAAGGLGTYGGLAAGKRARGAV
ncbi:MAG: phage baseplate assembly protein V, partial [Myxococcota bacterium]